MNPGFQDDCLQVESSDGRNFTLTGTAIYRSRGGTIYTLPVGTTTDGASTPIALWLELPPFGSYWRAAVLHDAAYRNTLKLCGPFGAVPADLTKPDADDLLKEAMELDNVPELKRVAIYEGVKLGGLTAFDKDRCIPAQAPGDYDPSARIGDNGPAPEFQGVIPPAPPRP